MSMPLHKSYRWIDLPLNLAVLGIYLTVAKLSLAFSITSSGATIFWPAGGFALAILLITGPKYLPGVFGGSLAAGLMIGNSLALSVLIAIGNALETFCAYWLLTHFRPINILLQCRQDFFKLLFYGATISTLISAAIGPLSLLALKIIDFNLLPSIVLRWWMADTIGIVLVTPLILSWSKPRQPLALPFVLELIALFFLTFLMGQIVVFHWFVPQSSANPSIAWLFPFIVWSGLRAGQRFTALLLLLVFLQALWSAANGIGLYANAMEESRLVNFWLFGMLIAVGGMLLAIMTAERKQAEQKTIESELFAKATIDASSSNICVLDKEGKILAVNQAWRNFYDENSSSFNTHDYFVGSNYYQVCRAMGGDTEDDNPLINGVLQVVRCESDVFEMEYPCHSPTKQRWFNAQVTRFQNDSGNVVITHENITDRKQAELREKSRSHILELISSSEPLSVVLEAIVYSVEQANPVMLCSILLLDNKGRHLLTGAAPSLPDFYNAAIEGVEIGVGVGSCGTAAFTAERVIVDDIQNHPYWATYKDLAGKAGLSACWSEPIRSKAGQVLGTFAIYHQDVHQPTEAEIALIEQTASLASIAIEQAQSRLALKASELRFRQMLQSIPSVAVQGYDADGTTFYWNQASEKLYGYSADEAIGRNLLDLIIPPVKQEEVRDAIRQMFETGQAIPSGEQALMSKGGGHVSVLCNHAYVHVPGQPPEMFCIDIDLTKRKQAEEALKESEEQLRFVLEGAELGFWDWDIVAGKVERNAQWANMLGYSHEEIERTTQQWADFIHPDDLDKAWQSINNALTGITKEHKLEYRMIHKNGDYRWILDHANVMRRDINGKAIRMSGTHSDITERKLAEEALQLDREFYRAIADNGMALVWMSGLDKGCFYFNRPWLKFTGRSLEQEQGNGWVEGVHPDDFERCLAIYLAAFDKQEKFSMVYRLRRHDGEYRWIVDNGVPRYDSGGKFIGYVGHCLDITESKQAEEKIKLLASVFTHAREGIAITDAAANLIEVNDTFLNTTGYSREEVIGQNPRMFKSGRQPAEFYIEMWKTLLEKGYWTDEVWNRRKNGEVYAEVLTISAVCNAKGVATHYVALCTDITPMKEHQQQLEHIAHYDVLTRLPNRSLLADRLAQSMLQCQRRHQSLAVVFVDLDGFKAVNDKQGHDAGDELLITVSQRMKEALREGDTLARLGGDEFVAVLADLVKVEDCEPVLDRLLLAASESVMIGEVLLQVSASIGVTIYPQDGAEADQLVRHADQAMYQAKQAGKNRYHLFDAEQEDAVKIQRENLGDIRSAFDRREFVLYYQPKVNMLTGDVIGVEALIRWQHPVRGLVSPIEFLPVIEGLGISLDIGEWVAETALTQISQWQTAGLNLPISINISAYQLQQDSFSSRLAALLAAHPDISPQSLELEVLETSAFSDITQVSLNMQACLDMGVRFALDDFGTGYSSLTYLRRLPASLIKIDQSFVRDMLVDLEDLAIVEGVVGLARSFKREVIAEGVETIDHGTALLQLGCELAQGYGIARPMPANELPEWVANWKPDVCWRI